MLKKSFCAVFLISASLLFLGCTEKVRGDIELEPTPDLALGREWALVIEPYVQFRTSPDISSDSSGHARKGDVIPVDGRKIFLENNNQVIWYHFEAGWLSESSVKIFSNESKAKKVSKSL
ncbi:MAG: hypothetical protein IKZ04_02555 [Spirochaetaceae bacterium]|nr:hypothetical protein [Spirochaetaceae bacterium]